MKTSLSFFNSFQIFVEMYKMHILCSIQVLKGQGATMRDSVAVNKEFMKTNVTAVVMTLQSLPVDVNLWGENSEPYISDWDLTHYYAGLFGSIPVLLMQANLSVT